VALRGAWKIQRTPRKSGQVQSLPDRPGHGAAGAALIAAITPITKQPTQAVVVSRVVAQLLIQSSNY